MNAIGRRDSERGSALVELAIALPLVILVLVATIDFARVFYLAMAVTNAARTGAQYGARSTATSGDMAGMQTAATNAAATDIGTISATASRLCRCADSSGAFSDTTPANDCSNLCPGGHLVVFVTVSATTTFTTLIPYPGVPNSLTITRAATMRAQ